MAALARGAGALRVGSRRRRQSDEKFLPNVRSVPTAAIVS